MGEEFIPRQGGWGGKTFSFYVGSNFFFSFLSMGGAKAVSYVHVTVITARLVRPQQSVVQLPRASIMRRLIKLRSSRQFASHLLTFPFQLQRGAKPGTTPVFLFLNSHLLLQNANAGIGRVPGQEAQGPADLRRSRLQRRCEVQASPGCHHQGTMGSGHDGEACAGGAGQVLLPGRGQSS